MDDQRQSTFLKLKPVCVQLSGVALRFRTKQAPAKEVLHALEELEKVLRETSRQHRLDPKLAEYVFFPLAQQVFNETKRLSPRCLEVAIDCVSLLVAHGYGRALQPALAKQLIILMSMIAGAGPENQAANVADDLQAAALDCISVILGTLTVSINCRDSFFHDHGTRNVVDQLTYLLAELIVNSGSSKVQLTAAKVLYELLQHLNDHAFLASLLPRTASSLTKATAASTKVRRSAQVLTLNLQALTLLIEKTLRDEVTIHIKNGTSQDTLDESWLRATVAQIKNVLVQVCKLRTNEAATVQSALEEICALVIEQCQNNLNESLPIVLETLLILAASEHNSSAQAKSRHFLITYPKLNDLLRTSLLNWSSALPRHLQSNDDRVKHKALRRISAAIPLLSIANTTSISDLESLLIALGDGLGSVLNDSHTRLISLSYEDDVEWEQALTVGGQDVKRDFPAFMFQDESLKSTIITLAPLLHAIRGHPDCFVLTQRLVDLSASSEGLQKTVSIWLILQLLKQDNTTSSDLDDYLADDEVKPPKLGRIDVLSELHATTFQLVTKSPDASSNGAGEWQLQALALEALTLHAEQFPGDTYRSELIETLYPLISFLASNNSFLRRYALVALNRLAATCQYNSAQDLVIANVDYLVNSVAWKLNTYNLTPEAPQILRMLILLCGARLIPYLDDLIQAIFGALDSFHGYPEWVELLFSSLKAIVDVAVQEPRLVLTEGDQKANVSRTTFPSEADDILKDLTARQRRQEDFDRAAEVAPRSAPHRSWTLALDGPSFPEPVDDADGDILNQDNDENEQSLPPAEPAEEEKKLSKSHKLLLQIATSTVPHLASPRDSVREMLLYLLKELSPLLGHDQESFLPLINAIWPVVVPRLFAEDNGNEETVRNIVAAAETISVLCETAGDFMAGRIEEIFQQLMKVVKGVEKEVMVSGPAFLVERSSAITSTATSTRTKDVQTIQLSNSKDVVASGRGVLRSSKGTILRALVKLLSSVLSNVELSIDTSDEIAMTILSLESIEESARAAVAAYNCDIIWLYYTSRTTAVSDESQSIGKEGRDMPCLRKELQDMGMGSATY